MTGLVLAFDTATERCVLALGRWDAERIEPVTIADFDAPRASLGRLLPAVKTLLEQEDLAPGDLQEVVVGRGPGSFTGVRIGVATAKGLAQGLGVSLFGAGTLDSVAWGCAAAGASGLLGVVGDAMRGEVYSALFHLEGGHARRIAPDRVGRPDDVVTAWSALDEPPMLTGDGLHKHRAALAHLEERGARVLDERLWLPSGAGLLAAYADARERGFAGDGHPQSLLPIYTRLSDAEEAERHRGGEGP